MGREPARAIPEGRWDPTFPRRDTTVLWSAAAPSHWRATSASPRDCRSPRSPRAWVARRPRSRLTSMTRLRLTKDLRTACRSDSAWSCTDVDLQASPRLSLRRQEAGVPTARFVPTGVARCGGESIHVVTRVVAERQRGGRGRLSARDQQPVASKAGRDPEQHSRHRWASPHRVQACSVEPACPAATDRVPGLPVRDVPVGRGPGGNRTS